MCSECSVGLVATVPGRADAPMVKKIPMDRAVKGLEAGWLACPPAPCSVLSRDLGLEGSAADQGGQERQEDLRAME